MDNIETEPEQPESESDDPRREVIQWSGLQECYEWLVISSYGKVQATYVSSQALAGPGHSQSLLL